MTTDSRKDFRFLSVQITRFVFEAGAVVPPMDGWTFDVNLTREILRVDRHENGDTAVAVKLAVNVLWIPQPGPFLLEVESVGHFACGAEFPDDAMRNMCAVHAPALIYSQVRTLVRLMAAEGGHPGFTLPLVNVAEYFRDRTTDDEGAGTPTP